MKLRARHAAQVRERGAVAVIVTVIMASGAVMGMLALSVDVGQIMSERRQLQNGADASAMALAQLCAKQDATACSTSGARTAIKPLANANANDQLSEISSVCANGVAAITATCEAGNAAELSKCPQTPGWLVSGIPYVEVKTKTETSAGSTVLTPFAKALTGNAANAGSTVYACARSAWGSPGQYTAKVPIVVSECEWKNNTSNGTVYQTGPAGPAPGYGTTSGQTPWPAASAEITIYLKSTTTVPCAINGKDTAGGFGYVDDSAGNCAAAVSINDWASINTGSSPPSGCYDAIAALRGTVVELPIFDCLVKAASTPTGGISGYPDCTGATGGGANSYYHVIGWAKFYLTGFKVGGSQEAASLRSGVVPCSGGDRCLSGWYVTGTLTGPGTIVPPTPGNNFGASLVAPAG
ncbi:pilus assembly protein TadG-related protein [Terrabacter sp. MAHUQ-38]|uniref:pilus assembly protein TadG-related protein n=1 Tax=unclassified Terrabacter TaxID=2630222 RepID=UPI00165D61E9|nr:TadE/TadG family type IV pilus assembly protein [Terrabacter sp. MAHUQ-38]MBC9822498.1 hypothetical protein [Terrabacter sp. MAHUQ-38]